MSGATEIGFAEAFEELRVITEKLNGDQVSADELVELLRRGKGLEAALRTHLADVAQRVEAIERGEGVKSYAIVNGKGGDARRKGASENRGASRKRG